MMDAVPLSAPTAIVAAQAATTEHILFAGQPYAAWYDALPKDEPAPIISLPKELISRYNPGDPTHSLHDEALSQAYDAAIQPMRDARRAFALQANRYTQSHHPQDAAMLGKWLVDWAQAGSLTQFYNHGGSPHDQLNHSIQQFNLSLSIPVFALSYAQVKPALPATERATIEDWLKRLDDSLEDPVDAGHALINHAYWKGAAHAAAGVATGDKKRFEKGCAMALAGIRVSRPDMLFPAELKRGERALDYHFYATVPLILTAELGMAQGRNLYEEEDAALPKLITRRLLPALQGDAGTLRTFSSLTGYRQNPVKQTNLPALAAFERRFPNPELREAINHHLKVLQQHTPLEKEEQTLAMPTSVPTVDDLFFPEFGGRINLLYPLASGKGLFSESSPTAGLAR